MKEDKMVNDLQVLNVNKELINLEKHNGFNIKKNNFLMFVKKLPGNIYKLVVLLLATIADKVPEFISKVPVIGYGVDFIAAGAKNYVEQVGSDEFFDKILCPLFGIKPDLTSPEYALEYVQWTHHEGELFKYSLLIKTIATFVMEHPALVLAGGAAIAGLAYKLLSTIVKGVSRKVKFNKMNKKQQEVYLLIKSILKKSRKIKKADNGKVLIKDLNITYDIVNYIGEYADMLDNIHNILTRLQAAIDNKNELEYERLRLELETSVFSFDRSHGNILGENLHLEESNKEVKEVAI